MLSFWRNGPRHPGALWRHSQCTFHRRTRGWRRYCGGGLAELYHLHWDVLCCHCPQIRLHLHCLPGEKKWSARWGMSFLQRTEETNNKQLIVTSCPRLENLLTSSQANCLSSLENKEWHWPESLGSKSNWIALYLFRPATWRSHNTSDLSDIETEMCSYRFTHLHLS